MKKIFFITVILLSINSLGQKLSGKIKFEEIEQPTISMFPHKYSEENTKVAYLIDGKLSNSLFILTVNDSYFDTYHALNTATIINGVEFFSQIYFTTKKGYEPRKITIYDIKKKYAKNLDLPCMYFINNNPIKIVEENIFLDENNILEVFCHLYKNDYDDLKINIIEIFTKTKYNIEK